MPSSDQAELLLRKASQDEMAVRKFIEDSDIPDEIIGFHAQQAVEKMLKAVLRAHDIRYPFTHILSQLIDLARDGGIELPAGLQDVHALTPFAAILRYEDFDVESYEPLDREWTLSKMQATRAWAEAAVADARRD